MTDTQMQKHTEGLADDARTFAPLVDVYEGKEETWLVADLPGVAKDALHIEIENGELRFRAKARPFVEGDEPFQWARAFRIPTGIDGDKVTADLREGVLVLKLPKPAELKPRKIDVRGA
jgi:HSP20 family protein